MHIFRYPDYESDTTRFIDQLKTERPNLEARQRAGRALLWDKNVDRAAWVGYRKARVQQKPYVYYNNARDRDDEAKPEPVGDNVG